MLGMEQMYKMALDPRIFPDSRLLAVLQGKDSSLPMAVAMSAKQQRDKLEAASKGQQAQMGAKQPTVRDQMLAKDLPPEQAGLDQLPAPTMESMGEPAMGAAGGLVSFAQGGFTDPDEDERETDQEELDSLMARQGDLGGLGAGIMSVANPKLAQYSSLQTLEKPGISPAGAPDNFKDMAAEAAKKHGASLDLVHHVMQKETGGLKDAAHAVSHKGATGVMQLMPKTAKELGVTDLTDPSQNINAGVKYLAQLEHKYKDPKLAAMAYNWGPGNVDKWLKHGSKQSAVPKETRMYVASLAKGGMVSFTNGGGINDLLNAEYGFPNETEKALAEEYGPQTKGPKATTQAPKGMSKEAAEFLQKQAAKSAPSTTAAAAEAPGAISGINKLLGRYLVPGAVYEGGKYASEAARNTLAAPGMESNRQALMNDPMLGAMGGDTSLASAIIQQNAPAIAQARQEGTLGAPAAKPAAPATAPAAQPAAQPPALSYEDAVKLEQQQGGPTRADVAQSIPPSSSQSMLDKYLAGLEQSRKQAPGLALMAAGLGIAGQRSPYALSNIGAGGLQGLQQYAQSQKEDQAGEAAGLSAQAAMERNKVYQQHYATAAKATEDAKYAGIISNLDKIAEDRIKNMTKFGNFNLNDPTQRQKAIDQIKNGMIYSNPSLRKYYMENTGMNQKDLYNMANPSLISDVPTGQVRTLQ
jgi:hypothetical protein